MRSSRPQCTQAPPALTMMASIRDIHSLPAAREDQDTRSRQEPERTRLPEAIVFFWENFGPTHVDRCNAVAALMPEVAILGIELRASSATYAWHPETSSTFEKVTLPNGANWLQVAYRLVSVTLRSRARHVFFCHYEMLSVEIAAFILRLLGCRIFTLLDSKYDDMPRVLWREWLKSMWLSVYHGAIVGSTRSAQYLAFLGMRPDTVRLGYDNIAIDRVRSLAGTPPAPDGVTFSSRHFTIVARLVPKKNLFVAIAAFALYAAATTEPRMLHIFGNGELEAELRGFAEAEGVAHLVVFEGFQQTAAICAALGRTLALLHVSTEEQFGLAIVEALAMGVPVIVSDACGARDNYVRSGVNGFLVEPDNPAGIAHLLGRFDTDEALWRTLSLGTRAFAERADARHFAQSVAHLIGATAT